MNEDTGSFWRGGANGQAGVRARNTRVVMAGAFVGALLVLALSTAFSWRVGGEESMTELAFAAPKGACLSWNTPDARDIAQVPCAAEHEFEVIGSVPVQAGPGDNPPRPQAAEWQRLSQQKCTAEAERYLGGKLDPFGKFSVGALTPTQEQWENGERGMRCGLQHAGSSGQPLPVTGSAKDGDQSDVHEPGTCLGLTPDKGVGDPVNCTKRHAYEIVGNVDLAEEFDDGGYPPEPKQSEKLPDLCKAELKSYSGKAAPPQDMVITWDTRKQASWLAGSTRVDCKVAGELSKGAKELQPVAGSVAEPGGGSESAPPGKPSDKPGDEPNDQPPGNKPEDSSSEDSSSENESPESGEQGP